MQTNTHIHIHKPRCIFNEWASPPPAPLTPPLPDLPMNKNSLQGNNGPQHRASRLLPPLCDWPKEEETGRTEEGRTTKSNYSSVAVRTLKRFLFQGQNKRQKEQKRKRKRQEGKYTMGEKTRPALIECETSPCGSLFLAPSPLVGHHASSPSLQLFVSPQLSTVNNDVPSRRGRSEALGQRL